MSVKGNFTCTVCLRTFALKSSLQIHELNHNTDFKSHRCLICGRQYSLLASLETHMLNHGPKVPYECSDCDENFSSKGELLEHGKVHDVNCENLQCIVCEELFSSENTFRKHLKSHINRKTFECTVCNETFDVEQLLKYHQLKHEVKSKKCPFCTEIFSCETEYTEHLKSHDFKGDIVKWSKDIESSLHDFPKVEVNPDPVFTGKNWVCSVCTKAFKYKKPYHKHVAAHIEKGERSESFAKEVSKEDISLRRVRHSCEVCKTSFSCLDRLRKHLDLELYGCEICNVSFSSCKDFKEHIKNHSLDCSKCGKVFRKLGLLKQHILIHTEAQHCEICKKTYPNEWSLRRHMMAIHADNRHVQCDLCGKLYEKRSLKSHMMTHTGERPYKCEVCGDSFVQRVHLRTHMKIHTGEKNYFCETCGKMFALKSTLDVHCRTHTGEKPYTCPICYKSFASLTSLRQHRRTHFPSEKFACEICDKKYAQKFPLYLHYSKTHSESELHSLDKELQKKIFHHTRRNRDSSGDINKKEGIKKYECGYCGKVFSVKANLQIHVLLHTGQKPHKCEVCGRSFRLKYSLKIHKRTHTGERPYQCNICEKRFVQYTHAKTHMVLHTGKKPYSCPICGKAFADKNNLSAHKKIHLKYSPDVYISKRHFCPSCGRSFLTKKDLMYHVSGCSVEEFGTTHNVHEEVKIEEDLETCASYESVECVEGPTKSFEHFMTVPSIECSTNVPIDSNIQSQKSQVIMISSEGVDEVLIHEVDDTFLEDLATVSS